jgi:hypothetical protein
MRANCKLTIVNAIAAISLVKRFPERLGFKSPLSARIPYPPHLYKDASSKTGGLLSGLIWRIVMVPMDSPPGLLCS